MTTRSRALTSDERALLSFLLEGDWGGATQARHQLATAAHDGWWFTGARSFDIAVDPDSPPIPHRDGILAATNRDVWDGDTCVGGVMIWLRDGRINSFEYYWTTGEMPTAFPSPSDIGPR